MQAIKALVFDVFGTVVDWRGSVVRELTEIARNKRLAADWNAFALAWRAGYKPAMDKVRRGEMPWTNLDPLHRGRLDEILVEFGIAAAFDETERQHLTLLWHRLDPWPDAVPGLQRLKRRFTIATLSNGHVALLNNMAKRAGLPWDTIFSAELFQHYKPDPETYLGAARLLGLPSHEVMMVAAHPDDLRAAGSHGLRTGFVRRPAEYGDQRDDAPAGSFDIEADNFVSLAEKLGA